MKKTKPNARERRRERAHNIIGAVMVCLSLFIIGGQGLVKVLAGDTTHSLSYWLQPISPVIQIWVAAVGLLILLILGIRWLRNRH